MRVSAAWVKALAEKALRLRKESYDLSIALVDNRAIRKVHAGFLQDGSTTDVITFDYRPDGDAELVISAECALQEAKRRGVNPRHELALYLIHGIMHLAGYDDHKKADREKMRLAEKKLLDRLGLPHVF